MRKSQELAESSPSDEVDASSTSHEPRPTHLTRYLIFFFMQAIFTALSWYCYVHPRLLPWLNMSVEDTTIRSGFTALFSLWQSAAVALALEICSVVFTREKATRNDPGTTVTDNWHSVITKSVSDFIHSGNIFKVALLAYPTLIILRIVGNSAITVSDGVGSERSLPIGLISTFSLTTDSTDIRSQAFLERRLQSNMIVRLEQLYKSPWGFVAPPNLLIPLPTEELNLTSKVIYESDVLSFHHDCQWQAPDNYSDNAVTVENRTWAARIGSNATALSDSRIVERGSSIIFLIPEDDNFTGDSVYLFLGANATISPTLNSTSNNTWIDLSNLPTIYNPDGFTSRFTTLRSLRAPLATLLVCRPDLEYLSRRVLLRPTANHSEPDITILSHVDVPSPGNINPQAARALFTTVLNTTIMSDDPINLTRGSMNTNWISTTMLLDKIDDETRVSYPPLDRKAINENVDKYTLSALKAFTSGYRGPLPGLRSKGGVFARSVNGEFTSRRLALWTSFPFAVLHTVLFGVVGIVLAVLAYPMGIPRL
ncbi:hypothetical protein AGABI2DRAFT_193977 [Agaricus bisporus var. bisporus H97]|uniref:hypothetical protein n=1 Tax=Agaricus bisporus var. bisporus (strain H97 / ATCC MYA-4626 / FGSC 10389) TaxID=936046 RepID=UPI00029F5533|nr:hypothetical protein AGABI2DRAFT_193977 [Agaricus bisporus var. bisporus H97]EKV46096.1 hypothetical protein AGABI2DRAFT_193977 [Agaricus bisporus var. bisporus H97]